MRTTNHPLGTPPMPPVLCAIEIGNTRAKSALFPSDSSALPTPQSEIQRGAPADGPPWEFLLAAIWSGDLTAILLSGSRPAIVRDWAEAIRDRLRLLPTASPPTVSVIDHHLQIGVPIDLVQPERVGLDRLLSARAALALPNPERSARIVISAGTATTIDLVTAEGHFAGGAILPGIDLGGQSLHAQTELLPRVSLADLPVNPEIPGRDTRAAIASGLYWGQIGAIREIAGRLALEQNATAPPLLTGGAAPRLLDSLAASEGPLAGLAHLPHLTLAGLALCPAS